MNVSKIKLPSNKKFGYFISAVLLIIAAYFFNLEKQIAGYIFLAFAIIILITTFLNPKSLYLLNKFWMHIGIFAGKIVSPIVLGLIFFGLFTPYGIVMKMMGRDELRLRQLKKKSYWRYRSNCLSQINFKKQF